MDPEGSLRGFSSLFAEPVLSPVRVRFAYAIAVATDIVQVALGPFGFAFVDETLDVIAAMLLWRLLGFHPLLLPTFVLEFVPVADLLPTWTGCVALVVALRRRMRVQQAQPANGDVIDV
jgi:hypothetical protein